MITKEQQRNEEANRLQRIYGVPSVIRLKGWGWCKKGGWGPTCSCAKEVDWKDRGDALGFER